MTDITSFLSAVVDWARSEPGLAAVALVGSHARGTGRDDSDIDLMLLCESPESYLGNQSWVERFGRPLRQAIEEWGKVTSVRVWYADGRDVEYGLAGMDWAADPADEGDARVVAEGIRILYEREGELSKRVAAFGRPHPR